MATMKEIAQICGVSRGTVDRVINRRGKVRPETERMILQAVERMGYTKSMLGRALSVKRSQPVIGVVMCSEGNPFFDDVYAGLARAEEELLPYGVTVERRAMRGYDVDRQLALIDELAPSLSALVLQPVNDPRVEARVQQLKARGVPTVTVNTDLPASSRCCYVGSDYESGGATAAALLELMTQARGRVGVVAGAPTLMGHVARLRGFRKRLARCSELPVVAVENSLYGEIRANLNLASRYDVDNFIQQAKDTPEALLSRMTGGVHLHTLHCPDAGSFERIKKELEEKGILYRKE